MSDDLLFREVDEEVRREEAQKLWNKYGSWAVALSAGIVIAVAAYKGWQYWQKTKAEEAGLTYFNALKLSSQGKTEQANQLFSKLQDSHPGYGVFARMAKAGQMVKAGQKDKAVALFDEVAAMKDASQSIRQIAAIRAAYLLADSASMDDLQKRLNGFEVPASPWRNQAREILALAAWRAGDYKQAREKMTAILADPLASQQARQRARVVLSVLAPKLAASTAKSN